MEADWDEVARLAISSSGPLGFASPATAIAFDDTQELLWVGTDQGRVISYHGVELSRYTSTKAHIKEGPVRAFLLHEKGVISCSAHGVHLSTRKGLSQWHLNHPQMLDLRCMSFTANPSEFLVAGMQSTFLTIDVEKSQVMSEHHTQANYTLMKKGRHICAATDDGYVHVLSLIDYSILMRWKAHSNMINDMDARNDFLVTCGFSVRQMGVPIVDPIANVYDLKNLKPLPPIPFHAGAAYVRLHPKLQTTGFVASQTGQMQVVDLMNPVNVMLKQANVQFMLGMETSSSGDAVVITDTNGLVYLWGSPSKIRFNSISKETELGNASSPNVSVVDWTDSPLNLVGMPYYQDRLLSAWPSHMLFDVGAPSLPLGLHLVSHLQPAELGQYGPHLDRGKLNRYQVAETRHVSAPTVITAPKFLSEKAKESPSTTTEVRVSDTSEALTGVVINGRPQTDQERMLKYSNVEIKYSRFGVDDFDFKYYNKTPFSGLETHISNSFVNSLLQLYKFIPLVRNVALQHAASACIQPSCLLCEFGFLFDMLEKAAGQNCQATNLLRLFGSLREAANLNLFEEAATANNIALSNTIQAINRFFLKQISRDYTAMIGSADGIDEVLVTNALEAICCTYCRNETTKPGTLYVHDLLYPQLDPKHAARSPHFRFSSILKATIERETKNRGWCNKCRRYQQLQIRKSVHRLPFVLMLNAALTNPALRSLWESPGWLPNEIGISLQGRNVLCFEGAELAHWLRVPSSNVVVYELVGFVAEIDTTDHQQPHLVSMVNVDVLSDPQQPASSLRDGNKGWHLFNDFLVSPVDPREALHFSKAWKVPCVLAYQVKSAHGKIDDNWKQQLDMSLLHQPYSINGVPVTEKCEMLDITERPGAGTPIALDTEFVELERPEIDVKADGSQETIRPAKSGLARVSVLRGEGGHEGKTFIDDYITIYEPIVDYKTQYSGIKPGDLDLNISSHNLVPMKVAYKKLWLLLNLGCVFVGHGLASDFRKANIHVPKAQTVDTQYLYLAPGKNRRFSLKYLAWAIFKEYIQEDTYEDGVIDGHDSIEDAHMALRLWRKYQEYESAGIVEQMVDEIYHRGQKFGWKPPPRSGAIIIGDDVMTPGAVPSGRTTPDHSTGYAGGQNQSNSPFKTNLSVGSPPVRSSGLVREFPVRWN